MVWRRTVKEERASREVGSYRCEGHGNREEDELEEDDLVAESQGNRSEVEGRPR